MPGVQIFLDCVWVGTAAQLSPSFLSAVPFTSLLSVRAGQGALSA